MEGNDLGEAVADTQQSAPVIESTVPEKGFWNAVPKWLLIITTFLLPVMFISGSVLSFTTLKAITFLAPLIIGLFIWTILRLKDNSFNLPFNLISLSVVLVIITYALSAIFSTNFQVSFFGRDFGFESAMVIISFFVFLLLGASVFKEKVNATTAYFAFILSAGIAMLWHVLNIVFFNLMPNIGFFNQIAANTVGGWFDLGVFAGIGVILSIISVEFLKGKGAVLGILMKVLFGLSLVLLILVGYTKLWVVVGIFALIFFIYFLSMSKVEEGGKGKLPALALTTLIISLFFVIVSNQINPVIREAFNISFIETSVTAETTMNLIKETAVNETYFGYGPGRFVNAWLEHRPVGTNLSDLWSIDFRYGSGLVPTMMIMSGVLGSLALLFFIVMFFISGFSSVFKPIGDGVSRYLTVSSFVTALYLWIMMFTYIPSYVTLFATFFFTAIFVASLYREGVIKTKVVNIQNSPRVGFVYIFAMVALLLVVILSGYQVTEKFAASIYDQKVNVALNSGDLDVAESNVITALRLESTDSRFKTLSQIQQIRTGQVINNSSLAEAERSSLFQTNLANAIQSARGAIDYDLTNYNNYVFLGDIFSELITLNVGDFLTPAKEAYDQAVVLNQTSPSIPLSIARAQFRAGENDDARNQILRALELKPNYTDAVFLMSQINVAEGNIPQAIQNIESASVVRPNDSVVFFELGILYYQDEQFSNAAGAFRRAVDLTPNYANARYFLGLSYDRVGQDESAIAQFEILAESNPGNQEVQFILENLEDGRSPFSDASEDLDDEPEDRDELPLDDELEEE